MKVLWIRESFIDRNCLKVTFYRILILNKFSLQVGFIATSAPTSQSLPGLRSTCVTSRCSEATPPSRACWAFTPFSDSAAWRLEQPSP